MHLEKVEIRNFRSIKDETILFDKHSCRVLIGKNETGKSNILKAIGCISSNYNIEENVLADKRIPSGAEETEMDSSVEFFFYLDAVGQKKVYSSLEKLFLCKDLPNTKLFKCNGKEFTLHEMILSEARGSVLVDLNKKEKSSFSKGFRSSDFQLVDGWIRIPEEETEIGVDGVMREKGNLEFFFKDDFLDLYEDLEGQHEDFGKPNTQDIESIEVDFDNAVCDFIDVSIPNVLYWHTLNDQVFYDDINIDQFIANPDSYPHFKDMCLLVPAFFNSTEDITRVFIERKAIGQLYHLFDKIQVSTTNKLKEIWGEGFLGNRVEIVEKGATVGITIREDVENSTRMVLASRSDGFKKFLKLLLSLSLKVGTKEIENTIILIDEAEIFLHPGSAECFRDELIKLSSRHNNTVVFSTHSPFMVDPNEDNIGRHLLVRKDREVTTVKKAVAGKYFAEELLWHSVGCGVIRALPPKTLLFEGWTDKVLFKNGVKNLTPEERKFLEPGPESKMAVAHAGGASHMRNAVPAFQAANSRVFIVCDSDDSGVNEKAYFQSVKLWGHDTFYTYLDLCGMEKQTAEDFVKHEKIEKAFDELKDKCALGSELKLECGTSAIMSKFNSIVTGVGVDKDYVSRYFKENIFNDLQPGDIKEEYKTILLALKEKITQ